MKTSLLVSFVLLWSFLPTCQAWGILSPTIAAAVVSSLLSFHEGDQSQLLQSLRPPTEDMPQIVMPSGQGLSNTDRNQEVQPLIQGLVYLTQPQIRPLPTDFLILEVRNVGKDDDVDEDVLVAGAKIPMTRIRFPLQFAMSEKNVLAGQTLGMNDLIMDAKICPTPTSCTKTDATLTARGIAKMISNVPGTDGMSIRAGASLGLR